MENSILKIFGSMDVKIISDFFFLTDLSKSGGGAWYPRHPQLRQACNILHAWMVGALQVCVHVRARARPRTLALCDCY